METTRTIILKLKPTLAQAAAIDATLSAFAKACDFIADVARQIHSTNKVVVQKECYKEVRQRFGLSANLAIRAIARVCAALKVPAKMHSKFAPTSVDYDARIFSFREWDWTVSLTLLSGREHIETVAGERQKQALKGAKPTSAVLVKRGDQYFLHIIVTTKAPEPIATDDFLGVDLGIANIATDSDGETYSGKPVDNVRRKHNLQRKRLGKRNTKGSKKKIRRIRNKEARFRRHQNHVISKKLVESAKRTDRGIALEDLEGIRERTTARGGDARNRLGCWSFAQLGFFITYKAQLAGVPVVLVDPRYTSQDCAECGHRERANRKSQADFECQACGHKAHADRNAARNIRCRALAASKTAIGLGNQPGNRVA